MAPDPKAHWYPASSPYIYALSNPVFYIDPNGLWTDPINQPTYRGWYGASWTPKKSTFGEGVRSGGTQSHQGVDLSAKSGTEVRAVERGKVVRVWHGEKFGKSVMLEFKDAKGNRLYAQDSHLSDISVKAGQEISEGVVVGKTGVTGNAKELTERESHLHFGISTTKDVKPGTKDFKNPADYMSITTPDKPKEESKAVAQKESQSPVDKKKAP